MRKHRVCLIVSIVMIVFVGLCTLGSINLEQDGDVDETTITEVEDRQLTLWIDTPGRIGLSVEKSSPKYDEIKSMLPEPDSHSVYPEQYYVTAELMDKIMKLFPPIDAEEQAKGERWQEKEYHWANVEAFNERVARINADRVIDQKEEQDICYLRDTWEEQLTSAILYVQNYRDKEPEFVADNVIIGNLEMEARRGLALIDQIECR